MDLVSIFAVILVLAAVFAYLNERFIRLPGAVGLMMLGLGLSICIQLAGIIMPDIRESAVRMIGQIDFSEVLLNFMLSFLLFAGSLHTDWSALKKSRGPILTFATVGVILSTLLIGSLLYGVGHWLGVALPYLQCLLFGALISPTDPIAVMGILRKARVPESLEIKIVGESLFNDGIGVVLFLAIFHGAQTGIEGVSFSGVALLLLEEIGGGILLGVVLGYIVYRMLKSIDHYQTEVLLTLALVVGGYLLADALHFSGPLTMVACGLLIGNKGRQSAMSDLTMDYTFKFWELVDETLNAGLFVLIGLELLVVPFQQDYVIIGLIMIPMAILSRYVSIGLPAVTLRYHRQFEPRSLSVMTWGGLRGGISIALAMLIPEEMHRDLLLGITYVVILFSILVQGLTVERLVRKVFPA